MSVPNSTDASTAFGTSAAVGIEAGRVNGQVLGGAHLETLGEANSRIHTLQIRHEGTVLLSYRGVRSVEGDASRHARTYRGREAARFVPGASNVSMAREERYADDGSVQRQQIVDDELRTGTGSEPAAFETFGLPGDAAIVAGLLDRATVADRSRWGYQVTGRGIDAPIVPAILENPRNATVRGVLRENGQVVRVFVRYRGTLHGRPVTVTQEFVWGPFIVEPVRPAWADE